MLERTMYLASMPVFSLFVVKDFIITDLMVSTMQKYEQNIEINQQQVNINVNIRRFAIIVVQENI